MLLIGVPVLVASLIGAWGLPHFGARTNALAVAGPSLPDCPVGGQPINLAVRAETDDGPVFFCCRHCMKKFDAEPTQYAEKVRAQRRSLAGLARIQVTCPVSGEPVKDDVFVGDRDSRVYFCCKNCRGKYVKAPAHYAAKLASSFTYQTKCPVTGDRIVPQAATTAPAGETVFFCCMECPEKFRKDPARYAPKLEEQGYRLDLSEKTP